MSSNPSNLEWPLTWGPTPPMVESLYQNLPEPEPLPSSMDIISRHLGEIEKHIIMLHEKYASLVQKAAYLEMPPDGTPFNETSYGTIPALGAQLVILEFTVPQGSNGSIKWIGNNYVGAGFTEGSGALVWQILADGQPIRNFENIIGSLGNPASPSETAPIRIYEGQLIQLVCTNVSVPVSGQLLGGRLSGWYYPLSYDQQQTEVDDGE